MASLSKISLTEQVAVHIDKVDVVCVERQCGECELLNKPDR